VEGRALQALKGACSRHAEEGEGEREREREAVLFHRRRIGQRLQGMILLSVRLSALVSPKFLSLYIIFL
jgi:hypothetical protein